MNILCLSPLLTLVSLLVGTFIGSPVFCVAASLRANSAATSNDVIEVTNTDLVGTSGFLVLQLEGYGIDDLTEMSPKQHAILDCAFHHAFDEIHGDHDGLYLSGQQIIAIDEEIDNPDAEDDDAIEDIELRRRRKYVHRPRNWKGKRKNVPIPYPPPKPPPRQFPIPKKWDIYMYIDSSGRCNMCPDDDSMGTSSTLVNTNNYQQDLADKKSRDEGIASDIIMSEESVNAIAYAMRAKLIEGTCATKEEDDYAFEYIRDTEIYVLSQNEFEESVAAITASREASNNEQEASSAAVEDLESSNASTDLLPFYYGGLYSDGGNLDTASVSRLNRIKIGLSGVGCGPWNNEALLDMNSGLHDSINSLGFRDKGHVIDKILGRRRQPNSERRYTWNCHYDVYAKVDVDEGTLDEPSLENIGDALCDDMVRNSGSEKFENTIDCQLQVLSAAEYESIVNTEGKAGLPVSVTPE